MGEITLAEEVVTAQASVKLFDNTVGARALWCYDSWTLRKEDMRALRSAQHRMLRATVGDRRRPRCKDQHEGQGI